MEDYLIPSTNADAEFVEKKSRFIGHVFRVETEEEALACLKAMRDKYWDATHNVYAYVLRGGAVRFSDDGEPGGTAGLPVLDVLQKNGISQVCCVVTRYFGGTLLGTGGLVRAYGKSAKLALEAAGISRRCLWEKVLIPCPYSMYEQVRRCVAAAGGVVSDTGFGGTVEISAMFPTDKLQLFRTSLTDISAGKITAVNQGQELRDFPVTG